jgi:ATP-dependent DNA helicase RecG
MKEDQVIEWKESWRDEYIKWICGFANAQGGVLVIGKNDDGKVVGIANACKLLEDIPNKVRDILGIIVAVNLKSVEGKDILEIDVEPYPSPISCRGRYYIRSGSTKQELKGASLDKFLLGKQGLHWDGVPVPYLSVDDLDDEAFKYFRMSAAKSGRMNSSILQDSNEIIIENLRLREGNYLRRATALLFHDNPEKFVPGAYVKIGFFRNDADLAYQDEVHGNLFQQAEKTLDLLLTKYMKAYISYEGITRVERFLFPRDALREVLLNAIVHRDYSTGNPIQIRVYDDQIRFGNDGQLPEGWSVNNLLQKHTSKPYNPLIAGAFFRTGDIESWGRGIDKIRTACSENRIDFPTFEFEPTGVMVEFSGIVPKNAGATQDSKETDKGVTETRVKTRVKLLSIIKEENTITREELAERLSITTKGIDWHIKKLKQEGFLKRIGARKGGHWEVIEKS